MTSPIADYPKTGIKVIIVGAGFGGITTGIECALKGHQATIVERASTFQQLGDIISISEYKPSSRKGKGKKKKKQLSPPPPTLPPAPHSPPGEGELIVHDNIKSIC